VPAPVLLARIERLLGARVVAHQRVQGGYTPALRLRCETATGSVFVKAGVTPLTAEFLRQEIAVYGQVSGDFMPRFLAADSEAEVPLLIIEDLSACAWPPPWDERRVALVREQLDRIHATSAPLEVEGPWEVSWPSVAADPLPFLSLGLVDSAWLDKALPALIASEATVRAEGDALCHFDVRSDNLCFSQDRAIFVDWNWAKRANPQLDLAFWLPSLAFEGGALPETILPDEPGLAAVVSGFFAARAGLPIIPDAPFVRRVQREQLVTALPWVSRALGLPKLLINAT